MHEKSFFKILIIILMIISNNKFAVCMVETRIPDDIVPLEDNSESESNMLAQQRELLETNRDNPGKNYTELKSLTEKGFTVTESSFQDLKENFNHAVCKVDLFEGDNRDLMLTIALKDLLNLVENPSQRQDFIDRNNFMSEYKLPEYVEKNPDLKKKIEETLEAVRSLKTTSAKADAMRAQLKASKFSEQDDAQDEDLITALKTEKKGKKSKIKSEATTFMEALLPPDSETVVVEKLEALHGALVKNKSIGAKHPFSRFTSGMTKAYQLSVATRVAEEDLELCRKKEENAMQKTTRSRSVEVGVTAPVGTTPISATVSVGAHMSEGMTDDSFSTKSK